MRYLKKNLLLTCLATLLATPLFAAVEAPGNCTYCNMDREKFGHTRMLIEYDDNSSTGLCSLHCAAIDLSSHLDKTPTAIRVGDYNSKELINAETAVWVIGGKLNGVMSARGKWAFAKGEDADRFIAVNGGTRATFEEAMNAAYEDMYKDTRMIRERRKMKRMQQMQPAPAAETKHESDHGKM